MPVWDEAITPSSDGTEDKKLQYALPTVPDLFYVDTNGLLQQVNPLNERGIVMYETNDACDPTIYPQVKNQCEVANPPYQDKPLVHSVVGCDIDGTEPPPIPSNAANLTPWTKSNFLAANRLAWLCGNICTASSHQHCEKCQRSNEPKPHRCRRTGSSVRRKVGSISNLLLPWSSSTIDWLKYIPSKAKLCKGSMTQ